MIAKSDANHGDKVTTTLKILFSETASTRINLVRHKRPDLKVMGSFSSPRGRTP